MFTVDARRGGRRRRGGGRRRRGVGGWGECDVVSRAQGRERGGKRGREGKVTLRKVSDSSLAQETKCIDYSFGVQRKKRNKT